MAEPSWNPAGAIEAVALESTESVANGILSSVQNPNDLRSFEVRLQSLLDAVLSALEAETGSVLLVAADTRLYVAASRGLSSDVVQNTCLELGEGISGYVLRTGEGLLVRNIEQDDRFRRRNGERYYTRSFASAPVVIDGATHGVMNVNNKRSMDRFDGADLALLASVGQRVAAIVQPAELAAWGSRVCVRMGTPPSD